MLGELSFLVFVAVLIAICFRLAAFANERFVCRRASGDLSGATKSCEVPRNDDPYLLPGLDLCLLFGVLMVLLHYAAETMFFRNLADVSSVPPLLHAVVVFGIPVLACPFIAKTILRNGFRRALILTAWLYGTLIPMAGLAIACSNVLFEV